MRIFDLIKEDIPRPPRNLNLYVKNRMQEMLSLQKLCSQIEKLIGEEININVIRDIMYVTEEKYRDMVMNTLDYLPTVAGRYRKDTIDGIVSNLKMIYSILISKGDTTHFYQFIEAVIYYLNDLEDKYTNVVDDFIKTSGLAETIGRAMEEHSFFNPEYIEPEDIQNYRNLLAVLELGGEVGKILMSLFRAKSKFQEVLEWRAAHHYGNKPKPKEIETFYHTTAYADDIAKNGFQTNRPENRFGLSSYGTSKNISFTHDIHTARTIARALKELVMIANGGLKKHTLLRWLKHDKLNKEEINSHAGRSIVDAPETIENNARLFNIHLWFNKVGRTNPLFANIEDTVGSLRGQSVDDVGIIKSKVKTTDHTVRYNKAEQEWQIPPKDVLSVERIQ